MNNNQGIYLLGAQLPDEPNMYLCLRDAVCDGYVDSTIPPNLRVFVNGEESTSFKKGDDISVHGCKKIALALKMGTKVNMDEEK